VSEYTIGPSEPHEVARLPGIELRAAALFSPEDLAPETASETTPLSVYEEAQREARLIVARDTAGRVVGFAHLIWVGGIVHLEEVDVEPEYSRRGIGGLLVEASCDWARAQPSDRITLSTFRDVPWNASFYARLGFSQIAEEDLSTALRRLRQKEEREGLDPDKRIMMCRTLLDLDLAENIVVD
jgi:GNAT superfamily N-acetyltransferase